MKRSAYRTPGKEGPRNDDIMISPSTGVEDDVVGETISVNSPAVADEKGIVELEACAEVNVATEPDAINNSIAGAADYCPGDNDGGEPDLDEFVMEAIQPDAEPEPEVVPHPPTADTKSTLHSMFTLITQDMFDVKVLFYLSIFSIIGSILRVFIGRLFGLDCEGLAVEDVFHQGFSNICVTATGLTEQTGGALFTDLPANMIGSMMMGVMTSGVAGWPSIPWLKADHPLQQDKAMNIAIRTGLCGSLTTFASWNSQMVVMLDGFRLPLGRQFFPAIFGYTIGLQASIACFLFGRKANMWINQCVNPHVCAERPGNNWRGTRRSRGGTFGLFADRPRKSSRRRKGRVTQRRGSEISTDVPNDIAIPGHDDISDMARRSSRRRRPNRNVEQRGTNAVPPHAINLPTIGDTESDGVGCCLLGLLLRWTVFPVIFVVVFFSLFVVSDVLWNILFYRTLWVSTLFTPFGAILRWRLSLLNPPSRKTFPLGTLIANILGSVVAILAVAIETRYLRSEMLSAQLLAALKIGFAGSLSTVSSFVKEVVDITERYGYDAKGYKYAGISLVTCCVAGVVVYSPLVRS